MTVFDTSKFGGWSIGVEVLRYMQSAVPAGANILVIGAGQTNPELEKAWRVTSIEHDAEFADKYGAIHVPLVNGWYAPLAFNMSTVAIRWDAVVIDGPPGSISRRSKMYEHGAIDAIGFCPLWIIDDVHRLDEAWLACRVAEHEGRPMKLLQCGDGKRAAVV